MGGKLLCGLMAWTCLMSFACQVWAQPCQTAWEPGRGIPGADGRVRAAALWNHDANAATPDKLVVSGSFTTIGPLRVDNVAVGDIPTGTWSGINAATNTGGLIRTLLPLPDGRLVVGGRFSRIGGVDAVGIAVWNGSVWAPLVADPTEVRSPAANDVEALALMPNGDIIAGGSFAGVDGVVAPNIARWNGTEWRAMAGGMSGPVLSLAVTPQGALYAGGSFAFAGGNIVDNVARWNASAGSGTWEALFAGTDGAVRAMVSTPSGNLIIGGSFSTAWGANAVGLAQWNGTAWSGFGPGLNGTVEALRLMPDGSLIAAGGFTASGSTPVRSVARWNGTAWASLGNTDNVQPEAMLRLPGGEVLLAGEFMRVGGVSAMQLATWSEPQGWQALIPTGTDAEVSALIRLANGDVIAGGHFSRIDGAIASKVARRVGETWSSLGTGIDPNGYVLAIAQHPDGRVIVGGRFLSAGDQPAGSIAAWNGAAWAPLGDGFRFGASGLASIRAVACLPNGDIVVAGDFTHSGDQPLSRIARWNGTGWSSMGGSISGGPVDCLYVDTDGSLIAGGSFSLIGGVAASRVARWDGSVWTALVPGSLDANVRSIVRMSDGRLAIGGDFLSSSLIDVRVLSSNAWVPLSSNEQTNSRVTHLNVLPTGELVASLDQPVFLLWDGSAWTQPVPPVPPVPASVLRGFTCTLSDGPDRLLVAGLFQSIGTEAISFLGGFYLGQDEPRIVSGPGGLDVCSSRVAELTATATGRAPLAHRWEWRPSANVEWAQVLDGPNTFQNGGETAFNAEQSGTPELRLVPNRLAEEFATWYFRYSASNSCGSATSAESTVAVGPACACYDFNADEGVDLSDAQQMAQVFVGLIQPQPDWLDGDLDGNENADLNDAALLARWVVLGTCVP